MHPECRCHCAAPSLLVWLMYGFALCTSFLHQQIKAHITFFARDQNMMHADAQTEALRPDSTEGIQGEIFTSGPPAIIPTEPLLSRIILLPVIIVLSYLYIAWRDNVARLRQTHHTERRPPTEPYALPLLGSVPLGYLLRPHSFVLDPKYVLDLCI
jgi:hypothetical protein